MISIFPGRIYQIVSLDSQLSPCGQRRLIRLGGCPAADLGLSWPPIPYVGPPLNGVSLDDGPILNARWVA